MAAANLTPPERVVRSWVIKFLHWRYRRLTTYIFVAIFIVGLGTLLQIAEYGQIITVIYGLVAIVFRIKSGDTYRMALISLCCVPVLFLMHNPDLADNFSIYTFLLLCIGTVCAILEEYRFNKKVRKSVKYLTKTDQNRLNRVRRSHIINRS